MKVLVLSLTPWSSGNSFGNSMSNIFSGIPDLEFANIYCWSGAPDNEFRMKYFQITEKSLINNLRNKEKPSGQEVFDTGEKVDNLTERQKRFFNVARLARWQILFWCRDLIWKFGRWNSPELRKFIDDFNPDLIFQCVYYSSYMNDIALFLKNYTNKPMLGYISDDCYTLRCFRFSPLFWIDRLYKRRKVKAVIDKCELLYVISEIQQQEYQKIFKCPIKILTKVMDTSVMPKQKKEESKPFLFLYTGNIGMNRWKSLALLAECIKTINSKEVLARLDIYTASPISKRMSRQLEIEGASVLHPPVSLAEVRRLQEAADVLVHVEGMDLKSRMLVHQSFSTKIIDYFASGRPILAVGPCDVASIDHLVRNQCAFVAKNKEELRRQIQRILFSQEERQAVVQKAWECGCRYHSKEVLQAMLDDDMRKAVQAYENSTN